VRAGQNMTGFGPDSIEPGGAMLKNTRRENEANGRNLYEWFVFAGVDGRIIGHNIFLDGSLFQDGPSVQSRDTVYDFSVGFSLRWEALRVSVTRIKRSEEFTTPVGGGGKQRFYSVNVGMEF
ncbi:MAG: lipid A deacylase LpxR family protein, partial [Betaproteobacteria bacterium]|nr:lipid A deacylase LpxR family protein [Betaproteobacteria bacterium]